MSQLTTQTPPESPASREPRLGLSRLVGWRRVLVLAAAGLVVVSLTRVITGANDMSSSGALIAALALAAPIALAGLGGLWSERAGVVNIGLEGMMIMGTWGAAFFAVHYGAWAGVLGAIMMGVIGGAIHALATVIFGVDHIVSGVALNLLGAGAAAYLATRTFSETGGTQSPSLPPLPQLTITPVSDALADVEKGGVFILADVASVLRALVTNLSILTVLVVLLLVATWWILWRTSFGLRLRSCGESPVAAETLGVNVIRYKFIAVLVSGGLAGLGGGFLAMVASNLYREGQTGGRGYIGLAAMIFGNWRPGGLAAGAGLFGYADTVNLRGGGNIVRAYLLPFGVFLLLWGVWSLWRRRNGQRVVGVVSAVMAVVVLVWFMVTSTFPRELTGMTPYLATLIVLAFASQRLRMPKADGLVYRKGEAS
ncbi:ABC transporter permease [Intrasporangium sp.]|jgi:simple sugar transport system permease protein|uniref:ABC transporter permease n=1 Tax=Intrasporangium sp. TaxID=1925024 RepID=UPI003365970F